MPLIKVKIQEEHSAEKQKQVMQELSQSVAAITGKSEQYIMVTFDQGSFLMAGEVVSGAFVEVRGIGGLGGAINKKLSAGICDVLSRQLDVSSEYVYINYADISASDWGWNNGTFG